MLKYLDTSEKETDDNCAWKFYFRVVHRIVSVHSYNSQIGPGADPEFPVGGGQPSWGAPTYDFAKFWAVGGAPP